MNFFSMFLTPSELRCGSIVTPCLHDDIGTFDREAQTMDKATVATSHFIVFRLPWDDNLLTRLNGRI
jgi:hypothetical protein